MAKGAYVGVDGVARKIPFPYIGVGGVSRAVKSGYVGVDGVARQFLAPEASVPVILEVEKITATTYVGETAYENEEFILLDIYPQKNGTVNVTYGGLTKTIADTSGAEEPNAQQIYFGTFNSVSDSVATPSDGTLTIEGDYNNYACGSYQSGSKTLITSICSCITDIVDCGSLKEIVANAFKDCAKIVSVSLPDSITSIGSSAFSGCTNLTLTELPDSITSIGSSAFSGCTNLTLTELPDSITSIEDDTFYRCTNLALTELPEGITSIGSNAFYGCTNLTLTELPEGITSIGNYAFYNCDNIGSVFTLPSSLVSIGDFCFVYLGNYAYMSNIDKYIILAKVPPTISVEDAQSSSSTVAYSTAIGYVESGISSIVVPAGCGDVYKAAEGWSCYTDLIVEAT